MSSAGQRSNHPGRWLPGSKPLGFLAAFLAGAGRHQPDPQACQSATEVGLTTGRYTFTRTGSTAALLTVSYRVTGTTTLGSDYVALGTSIVITAGKTQVTKTLTPKQDTLQESPETVILTLKQSPNYAVGTLASATVTIRSDE